MAVTRSALLLAKREMDDPSLKPIPATSSELRCAVPSPEADMRRKEFLYEFGGVTVVWPLAAHAQPDLKQCGGRLVAAKFIVL